MCFNLNFNQETGYFVRVNSSIWFMNELISLLYNSFFGFSIAVADELLSSDAKGSYWFLSLGYLLFYRKFFLRKVWYIQSSSHYSSQSLSSSGSAKSSSITGCTGCVLGILSICLFEVAVSALPPLPSSHSSSSLDLPTPLSATSCARGKSILAMTG